MKIQELSAYQLNFEQKNLFDENYGNQHRNKEELKNSIIDLKKDSTNNFLKIGRNLLESIEGEVLTKSFDDFVNNEEIQIKKSQAIKYIETYNYCNYKFKNAQPTDESIKLGIEKLYLVTKLEARENRERLEKFISDKKLTVKQLAKLVEVLNGNNEILKLVTEFNNQANAQDETKTETENVAPC